MPVVWTPFSTEPIEVDEEEAASMARQGLLRDTPPDAPAPIEVVTVTTVYGEVTVDVDEAAVLAREGLLAAPPAVPPAPAPPIAAPVPAPKENDQ